MPAPPGEVVGGFGPLRARCSSCKEIFRPNPRLKGRQKTCGQLACRRDHRAKCQRQYRKENPELEREYCEKRRRGQSSDYWKSYRSDHPKSTERNRVQSRLRAKLKREGLQRKLDIVQVIDPTGYFDLFCGFATRHRSIIEEIVAMSAA